MENVHFWRNLFHKYSMRTSQPPDKQNDASAVRSEFHKIFQTSDSSVCRFMKFLEIFSGIGIAFLIQSKIMWSENSEKSVQLLPLTKVLFYWFDLSSSLALPVSVMLPAAFQYHTRILILVWYSHIRVKDADWKFSKTWIMSSFLMHINVTPPSSAFRHNYVSHWG